MEKYLILLSPSLSQDLFGNNTISPPWQLFATSPVCFWHRHLHPPEKLHHKLYTFTFWSFFSSKHVLCFYEYLHLPEKLHQNCTPSLFCHFFLQNIFFVFTNIYTCLRNCTTKCTPSLVCHFFCKTCSLFYKDLHPPEKLHHKLYAFTCLLFCSSYKDLHLPGLPSGLCAICDLVILFAKAWLICVLRVLKCLWNWVECVLTRLAQNIFPLGTEQLIFKQGQHRAIPKHRHSILNLNFETKWTRDWEYGVYNKGNYMIWNHLQYIW